MCESARGSRVHLLMNKCFCTTVKIKDTFNVNIMLYMPRKDIENRVRAKRIILLDVSHRDVARFLLVSYQSIQIMAYIYKIRMVNVQQELKHH